MNDKIKRLSKMLFEHQNFDHDRNQQNQYTLVLGAGASISSGCPSWQQLCKEYCEEYSVEVIGDDYSKAFQNEKKDRISKYLAFAEKLGNKEPSMGYYHLATLIEKDVFKTIITTNYDNLLEKALTKIMPIEEIKVLIRGEVTDDYIARFIKEGIPKVKIIKLHGDLQSNIFFYKDEQSNISADLQDALNECVKNGSIIVGHEMEDDDLVRIFTDNSAFNYFVNPVAPNSKVKKLLKLNDNNSEQIINDKIAHKTLDNPNEEECLGNFDTFFKELNLEFQKNIIKEEKEIQKRRKIEADILKESEKGVGYINYDKLELMITNFWHTIETTYNLENNKKLPDVIVFINDPSAPGGMELRRQMSSMIDEHNVECPNNKILVMTMQIKEEKTRDDNRKVDSLKPKFDFNPEESKDILILDPISFSGNTLRIAIKQFKTWFPNYKIRGGIMMVDDQLIENIKRDNNLKDIIHKETTTRYEILFPWGITQVTGVNLRNVKGLDVYYPIRVERRPWGTVAILTELKNYSVRILTIEANQQISFQRHLLRDEFFISLDENIGLEICSELLEDITDINDVKEKKSLILEKGDYVLIPKGIWHRVKASKDKVRLLEISYGIYDQKYDIMRLDDAYGRTNLDGLN